MLYPDFNELVSLKAKATNLKLFSSSLIKSPINGNSLSPFRGHGLEFAEVRKYSNGDDVRRIDWRVTARTGSPHIKLFTEEKERTVLLVIDQNSSMSFGTRGTFKSVQAARCASYIGWSANKDSNLFGAVLFGSIDINTKNQENIKFFPPTRSRKSLWQTLKTLSKTPSAQSISDFTSLQKAIEFTRRVTSSSNLVFIISDFMELNEQFQMELSRLSLRCQVVLISVNDPADMELSCTGDIIFSSSNKKRLYVSTADKNGKENYHKQWENRCTKLQDITTKLGIYQISLLTNRDVYFDLFYGLKKLAKLS